MLEQIVGLGVHLENDLALIRWNLAKTYLRDLEARGVAITPTLWLPRLQEGRLEGLFARLESDEIVVDPVVGANAEGAFRLDRASPEVRRREVERYFADRALMAQPLARAVLDEATGTTSSASRVPSSSFCTACLFMVRPWCAWTMPRSVTSCRRSHDRSRRMASPKTPNCVRSTCVLWEVKCISRSSASAARAACPTWMWC